MSAAYLLSFIALFGDPGVPDIRAASSWVYQLQRVNLEALARYPADVVVIDTENEDGKRWRAADLQRLKAGSGRRRVVLAYLSVGEAEDYRDYWRAAWKRKRPSWVGPMNPAWRGNYPVQFWTDAWREIVLGPKGLVARAMAQGFDGVYLDRLDVYSVWGPTGRGAKHEEASARAMVQFVRDIAAEARRNVSSARVVAQNAWPLYEDASLTETIDAVALEDVFYEGASRQPRDYTRKVLAALEPIKARKLPIFSVDYGPTRVRPKYVDAARAAGLIPYAAPSVALDRLPPVP